MGESDPSRAFVSTKERISGWIPRGVCHAAGTSQDVQSQSACSEYCAPLITPAGCVLTCTPSIPMLALPRQVISRAHQGHPPRSTVKHVRINLLFHIMYKTTIIRPIT